MDLNKNSKKKKTSKYLKDIGNILDDGFMNISAPGVLNIHGVDQDVIIDTNLNMKNGTILFYSEFNVPLKDYKIKIPKIVRMNIADTILVKVSGELVVK